MDKSDDIIFDPACGSGGMFVQSAGSWETAS
ncbi:MAG: N-6 DNA methylase [Candidatus Methanoperedens sp.]|nr:N-6 DNA methylase [Candidatus Methanoperedens sp.]